MTLRIDQFHNNVADGSSITKQMLNLQAMLKGMGHQSELFCEQLPARFEGKVRSFTEYASLASVNDILLLHFSLNYSATVINWLKNLPCRKILIYHNITPHHYFTGVKNVYWEASLIGRQQLEALKTLVEAAWADSTFNLQELAEYGFLKPGLLPIIFNPQQISPHTDKKLATSLQGSKNILFVGRIAPNKRIEDIILAFYYFKRRLQPNARLFLVGTAHGMEIYLNYLQTLIAQLGLTDVFFTGHILPQQWRAYYEGADIYLSMSEHEGFGIPLLECMHFEVPILAYKAAAVPETMGQSGILITQKNFPALAELMNIAIEDSELRAKIIAGQKKQLQKFMPSAIQKQLQALLSTL